MSQHSPHWKRVSRRALRDSSVEFVLLLALWLGFVCVLQWNEWLAGAAAALLAAVADGVVKATDFSRFRPRFRHLATILLEPWYVLQGTWEIFAELARHCAGKPVRSAFVVVPFEAGGDDPGASARRALAIAYTTIGPNSIVVGIDRERHFLLLHALPPGATPEIALRLGAKP